MALRIRQKVNVGVYPSARDKQARVEAPESTAFALFVLTPFQGILGLSGITTSFPL